MRNKVSHRRKILVLALCCQMVLILLMGRLSWLMLYRAEYYAVKAEELHVRERSIKAKRGQILDRNGQVLADNRTVCTVSVIHNQLQDKEQVIRVLCEELGLSREYIEARVNKVSSIEKIRGNVEKETGDRIRGYNLPGVKVDEDYKRYYPYGELASKVLGFTGADNQGIIGLEVKYEEYLQGKPGTILTTTDARGLEVEKEGEKRVEPESGNHLVTSLDLNIQQYATQLAKQVMETKQADRVAIFVMNPQNGEIYASVDVPEFDLNDPYALPEGVTAGSEEEKQELLNGKWRNACINDTYEPGSTFKIITTAAALEEGLVHVDEMFSCPGFIIVEDRKIRCHKTGGHGGETFTQGIMNSCNPVFISLGLRLGVERYYDYFQKFGLMEKTGIDLPGEAGTIMHKKENMGPVELATVAFGQSFQISPVQLAVTAASLVNGGIRVTPHLGVKTVDGEGNVIKTFGYETKKDVVSEETSAVLRELLEKVVSEGTGKNGYVEGFRIGGKTATSQTLPRGSGKYIASFLGFAPADDPQVMALAVVYSPKGVYYGGQVAAPVVRQLFENILPYLQGM
ncbi:MAG: peptidoglycan glycosyltransferase [Lachnospiraceae bacterium]|nr:peptidoglycan glycosyltransferase [Lachnospiraceae bacterium]